MAFVVKDRVRETSVTAGTGALTLAGAVAGFQTFAAIGNGNTTYYCIADPTTGAWEVGLGTYTASGTSLSRDTVYANSLGTTAKINFAANTKDVFCTYPAERSVTSSAGLTSTQVPYADTDGQLVNSANMTFDGTKLTVAGLKDSALTATRVTYAGVAGELTDSANMTFDGTKLTVAGLKDSALTSGRVPFATTGGELTDSGSLTWDGTYLTAGSIKDSALTSGRVTYAGASGLLTDSGNLTFNGTTLTANTLNLTNALGAAYGGTGSTSLTANNVLLGNGTSPVQTVAPGANGNVLTSDGTTWTSAAPTSGGASLSNDTTTATNEYPLFAAATTGTPTTLYTSNAKLLYKPSTGEFQMLAPIATNGINVNNTTAASSYTIASSTNGLSVGPVTLASGVTISIASGQRWQVI